MFRDTWTKPKEYRVDSGGGDAWGGGSGEEKMETTVLEQFFKKEVKVSLEPAAS